MMKTKAPKIPARDVFTTICKTDIGVECVKEFQFHPERKWRFDYAIPSLKIAIEQDGGVWTGGRHTRPKGYLGDLDKFNAAASLGWVVLKFTPGDMLKKSTLDIIRETLKNRKNG